MCRCVRLRLSPGRCVRLICLFCEQYGHQLHERVEESLGFGLEYNDGYVDSQGWLEEEQEEDDDLWLADATLEVGYVDYDL